MAGVKFRGLTPAPAGALGPRRGRNRHRRRRHRSGGGPALPPPRTGTPRASCGSSSGCSPAAYIAVAGSVVYGLLLSTKLLDAIAHRPISFSLHQDLAAIGLGLAGIHGMLLGLDHSVPFTIAQILVPGLAPHAPVAVAFGQVALYLVAAVTRASTCAGTSGSGPGGRSTT